MNFTWGIVWLSKNVADFGKLQEKQLQEVHERSKIILDKVDIISENTSEKLDIQPILDKIDLSIPNLSNISSSLGTIKTQNTKLSQKIWVVIDNQEIEIINQEENDKKLIEIYKQEAQLIEKDLEDIYKKEADQIEQELKNIYKQEADQIEKELSNQL